MPEGLPTKRFRMDNLEFKYSRCMDCGLGPKRKKTIFGRGSLDADVVFVTDRIAEADIQEDMILSGPYGHWLETVLSFLQESVDGAWLVGPTACPAEDGKAPKVSEMRACRPKLHEELHIIQPKVVVAMGSNAVKALWLKNPPTLIDNLGRMMQMKLAGSLVQYEVPVMFCESLTKLLREPDSTNGGSWNRFVESVNKAYVVASILKKLDNKEVTNLEELNELI